jgi:hypothetical protein
VAADPSAVIAQLQAQAAGNNAAASATAKLDAAIKAEQAALAGLGGSLDAAKAKLAAFEAAGNGTIAAHDRLAASVKKLDAAYQQHAATQAKLAGSKQGIAAAEAQTKANKEAADSARAQAGAWGDLRSAIESPLESLKAAGPEGYAVALGLMAAAAGVTVLVGALLAGATAAVAINEKLTMLRVTLIALAGGAAAGGAAYAMVQRLSTALPFSTEQIATWTKSMLGAGFAGKSLEAAVRAVAAATAVGGEEAGAAAAKMLKTLQEGGKGAADMMKQIQEGGRKSNAILAELGLIGPTGLRELAAAAGMTVAQFKQAHLSAQQMEAAIAKALQKKGASSLEAMMLSFPVMLEKLKEGIGSLFSDLGPAIEPFLKAVRGLFGEFGKTGAATKALKPIVTEVFATLFKYATMAVNAIHQVILGFMGTKNAKGPWAEVGKAIRTVVDHIVALAKNKTVIEGLKVAFVVLAGAVFIAMLPFMLFAAAGLVLWGVIALIVTGLIYAAGVVSEFVGEVEDAIGNLPGMLSQAGANIIGGLVSALDPGPFIAKMLSVAQAGLAAFTGFFGIHSDSAVMMKMGGHVVGGLTTGVEDAAPAAQAAVGAVVNPAALKLPSAGGGKAGKSIAFTNCTFGGDLTESIVRGWVYRALDEDSLAGPEAAPS